MRLSGWDRPCLRRALCGLVCAMPALLGAQESLPESVSAHIDEASEVVVWKRADFDGDGRQDVLLVWQRKDAGDADMDAPESRRVLQLLLGTSAGGFRSAVVNDQLVMCQACGGTWPDPLDEITVGRRSFTVSHYGGSRWRWSNSWRFDYDVVRRTWMLSVATEGFDTQTQGHRVRTYRRGQHVRDVRLQDFDPQRLHSHYLRRGVGKPRAVLDPQRS